MKFSTLFNNKKIAFLLTTSFLSFTLVQSAEANYLGKAKDLCGNGQDNIIATETRNHLISICGGNSPNTYIILDKRNKQKKKLTLTSSSKQSKSQYYKATDGNHTYILEKSKTFKGLTIIKDNNKKIMERIIKGW